MLFLVGTALYSFAQETKTESRYEIEIDPVAYALKGYSLHGIYVHNRIRTDLGVFGIVQPQEYSGNKGFEVKTKGVGLKVNYLLNQKQTWFSGIGLGYSNNNIRLLKAIETQSEKIVSVGFHLGYRWFMFKNTGNTFKNLYLAPWFSIDYNRPLNRVYFENQNYKQRAVSFFPTLHIGYKF